MSTEITIIQKEDHAYLEALKTQAGQIALQCKSIVVTNDTERHIAIGILTDARKGVKKGQDWLKSKTKPYKDKCKELEANVGEVLDPIDAAVAIGNKVVLAYDAIKAQEALAKQQRINNIKTSIEVYKNVGVGTIKAFVSLPALEEWSKGYISEVGKKMQEGDAAMVEKYGEFLPDALEMVKGLRSIASAKKAELSMSVHSVAAAEILAAMETKIEEKVQNVGAVQTAAAENVATPSGVRSTWTYEVMDKSLVPDEFKEIIPSKVNEQMRTLKALNLLVDGQEYVENGIKYFQKKGLVAR